MRYIAFIKAETLINNPQLFGVLTKRYFSNIQDFSGEYFGNRKPSIKDLKKFVELRNIKVVGFDCNKKFKLLRTTSVLTDYNIKVIEKSVTQFSVNEKICREMYVELCKELLFSENGHNLIYIIAIEE